MAVEPPDPRPLNVESLLELAGSAVDGSREHGAGEQVLAGNTSAGIAIDHDTLRHGIGLQQDLRRTVAAISGVVVGPEGALTA